jgi:superfamily I DNA/RNA helicase
LDGLSFCGPRLKVVKNKQVLLEMLRKVVGDPDKFVEMINGGTNSCEREDSDSEFSDSEKENNPIPTNMSENHKKIFSQLLEAVRRAKRWGVEKVPPQIAAIADEYCQQLEAESQIDLSMIVSIFLQKYNTLNPYIESVGQYLFVDEFQDLDPEQVTLVQRLIDSGKILTAVGDVNQSIYGWRQEGKRVRIHTPSHSNYQMFCFSKNLRSADAVVRASNRLVDTHNVAIRSGGFVKVLRCKNEIEELLRCAFLAKQMSSTETPVSLAVLFRLNSDKERFVKILDQQKIPFHGKHVADIGEPKRSKAMELLLAVADAVITDSQDSIVTALLMSIQTKKNLEQQVKKFLEEMGEIELKETVKSKNGNLSCKSVINEYLGKLSKIGRQTSVVAQVETLIAEFKIQKTKDVKEFQTLCPGKSDLVTLMKFFKVKEQEAKTRRNAAHGIYVGTIHSSKGREWKSVIIPLVNDGVFPADRCDVEEEKRVLYVGLTRARDSAVVMCSKPSRLVEELHIQPTTCVNEVIHGLKSTN